MYSLVLSFSGADFFSPGQYHSYLSSIINSALYRPGLVVLPGYSALLFSWKCGFLGHPQHFSSAVKSYINSWDKINENFLDIHRDLAEQEECCIVPGTMMEKINGELYHFSVCIDEKGDLLGSQRQTHLTLEEKKQGFSRGSEVNLFHTTKASLGIILGTDAWYPEVSRIIALSGADIICHPGALTKDYTYWHQLAGMWQEVQQNQFYCLESQLNSTIVDREFCAYSAVHAPCEITEGKTGYLAFGEIGAQSVEARLEHEQRKKIRNKYPILSFANPEAYLYYIPHLYYSFTGGETERK